MELSRDRRREVGFYPAIKRALDFTAALVLLVMLFPGMLLIALWVSLDSPGPPIYTQERVGRGGRLFRIYKFRSMHTGTPTVSTAEMLACGLDAETRAGTFLRRASLDELPQLLNIIRGEMSFIGPRPALPSQTEVNEMRERLGVHKVRPGLSGLAQVIGRDTLDDPTKVECDARYCREMSPALDLQIVWRTLGTVVSGFGKR